jgi:hypothetical protein
MYENGVYAGTYVHPSSNYSSTPPKQDQTQIAQAFQYPNSANGPIQNNGPCAISPPRIWEIIENSHSFAVRLNKKNLPERCLTTCFPCSTREENSYSIFAGFSDVTQNEILRVDEVRRPFSSVLVYKYLFEYL